jgi:hypothetical protein
MPFKSVHSQAHQSADQIERFPARSLKESLQSNGYFVSRISIVVVEDPAVQMFDCPCNADKTMKEFGPRRDAVQARNRLVEQLYSSVTVSTPWQSLFKIGKEDRGACPSLCKRELGLWSSTMPGLDKRIQIVSDLNGNAESSFCEITG